VTAPVAVPTAPTGNVCVWQQCRSENKQSYGQCAPGLECVGSNGYYAQCREPPYIDGCQKSNNYCTADGDCCGEYSECRSNKCMIPCGAEISVGNSGGAGSTSSSDSAAGSGAGTDAGLLIAAIVVGVAVAAAVGLFLVRRAMGAAAADAAPRVSKMASLEDHPAVLDIHALYPDATKDSFNRKVEYTAFFKD
jgi:hypothetical protein